MDEFDELKDARDTDDLESGAEGEASVAEEFAEFYGKPEEVVSRYTHCPDCGSNLHFSHLTDFSRNLTQETAKCPECGLKARRATHRLQ